MAPYTNQVLTMYRILPLTLCLFALPACQTVRTVYDLNGNEVKEHSGERSLEAYMQDTFDSEVTRSKNKDGVPESTSSKVSRYQKDIDAARKSDKTFSTSAFGGTKAFSGSERDFRDANKKFDTGAPFGGTFRNSAYSTDLRPAFMSDTKGVFSRDDAANISSANRAEQDGRAYDDFSPAHTYSTGYSSDVSRDITSGYFESRKDKTKKPRIFSHQDYYRKTIRETRTMLGRDEEPTEE